MQMETARKCCKERRHLNLHDYFFAAWDILFTHLMASQLGLKKLSHLNVP
jgi:hypothetical protein